MPLAHDLKGFGFCNGSLSRKQHWKPGQVNKEQR
jgi:hypothetical protein